MPGPTSYTRLPSSVAQPPAPYSQHPSQKPKLLIVEDDEAIRTQMKWLSLRIMKCSWPKIG